MEFEKHAIIVDGKKYVTFGEDSVRDGQKAGKYLMKKGVSVAFAEKMCRALGFEPIKGAEPKRKKK